jgi:IS5 family transposase
MKNANYNLVKMLLTKLDDSWRVERHYAKDAAEMGCAECQKILEGILADDRRHIEDLRQELAKHIKGKKFD